MAGKWKHGWVPVDGTAALEKAHGSKTGASKALKAGTPKTPPKIKNPGGRNMQDLSGPKRVKGAKGNSGVVDLGKLPPGFGAKAKTPKAIAPGLSKGYTAGKGATAADVKTLVARHTVMHGKPPTARQVGKIKRAK